MNYTVFYSWQSDLENKYNRSFIQDALENATKSLSKDENFSLDAVVDRDTYGIIGSPSIVESITGKIANSDVFVCDISIINSIVKGRPTPNPNVLYELGFASAILGWERIIMIQNTAYGSIETLPFDLRGRRILQYYLDDHVENKSEEKKKMKQKLTAIFQDALKYYGRDYISKEKIVWWGKWNIETKIKARGGQLHISKVSSDAFFFKITIFDGARSGEISGKAKILTPHSAYARIKILDNKDCEIIFRRRLENSDWWIDVEQGENCNYFHGHNATFSGKYKHATEMIINEGYLDEIDLNEIERMAGKYMSVFLDNFQQYASNIIVDEELTIIQGAVKGLYNIMESIIALDKFGGIWFAFIDPKTDVVRYFSNLSKEDQNKPKSIRDWLSRFSNKQIFENDENA